MITHLFIHVLCSIGTWMIGLFPAWSRPAWVDDAANTFTGILANVGPFGYFIPLGTIGMCLLYIVSAVGVAWAIKLFRVTISMATGGGGATE